MMCTDGCYFTIGNMMCTDGCYFTIGNMMCTDGCYFTVGNMMWSFNWYITVYTVLYKQGPINYHFKFGLSLINNISNKIIHVSDKFIRNYESRIHVYSPPMHVYRTQFYFLEKPTTPTSSHLKPWSPIITIIRINNEGNSLIKILGPGCTKKCNLQEALYKTRTN